MDRSLALLLRYLRLAWRRRWVGVGVAWAVCIAGWVGLHEVRDQYRVRARLFVDADAVLTPLLRGIAVDANAGDQLAMLQRTLLSRPNLLTLISKTDLGLNAASADARERLVQKLGTEINLQSQDKNLFAIEYQNASPRLARDVVQTLLSIFTEEATGNNRADMDNALRFLRAQIASYEQQLHRMEERRATFRAKYAAVLPAEGAGSPGGTVESQRDVISHLDLQLQDAKAREAQLKGNLKGLAPTLPSGGVTGDVTLDQAEAHLHELQTLYTDRYPGVIEQRKLVEQLRRTGGSTRGVTGARGGMPNPLYDQLAVKLVDELANVASLTRQMALARETLARIEQIRRDQPSVLVEFDNQNRDYGVLQKNYEELLARLQAATLAQAADIQADKVHLRVIDPPEVPLLPVSPNRPLLLTGVWVVGLGAGFAAALGLAQFDRSFATLEDLRALGLPVLGGISAFGAAPIRRLLFAGAGFAGTLVLLVGLYGGLLLHLLRGPGTI